MIRYRKNIMCVPEVFSCGRAVFSGFLYSALGRPPVMGLAFCFGCFLPGQAYAYDSWWFPSNAVICKIPAGTIDLGKVDGTLASHATSPGNFQGECKSTAGVAPDSGSGVAAEAAYCLTIRSEGGKDGIHYLYNADKTDKIAFRFINTDTSQFIGDGTSGGNPLFRRGQKRVTGPVISTVNPPVVPLDWSFGIQLVSGGGTGFSAGSYSGTVIVHLASGAERHRTYPAMTAPSACSGFPRHKEFPVTIRTTVQESCNVQVEQYVNFGTTLALQSRITGRGRISVRCTDKTQFQVGMSKGLHGTLQQRLMKKSNSAATVAYNLYHDYAGTRIWTDEWNASGVLQDRGNGKDQYYDVYGIVPPQSLKPYGSYADSVRVEIRMK